MVMFLKLVIAMLLYHGSQGLTPSLTVELSQVGMLSPNYTVSVTRGEILHVGESISNLTLSGGEVLNNSSAVTFTETVYTFCTQSHKHYGCSRQMHDIVQSLL